MNEGEYKIRGNAQATNLPQVLINLQLAEVPDRADQESESPLIMINGLGLGLGVRVWPPRRTGATGGHELGNSVAFELSQMVRISQSLRLDRGYPRNLCE